MGEASVGRTLDPADWAGFRVQAHRMLDDMLDATAGLREQAVWRPIPEGLREAFRGAMPVGASGLAEVHEEFLSGIVPFTARNAHPGFMGWMQGGGTAVGMLAEMLAAGLNANCGGRDQMPLEVERQVTGWMRELFGFPAGASGVFCTGTSMANLLAVLIARDARLGADAGFDVRREGLRGGGARLVAYASEAVHGSVGRGLDFAGLGSDALRMVVVDGRQRMDVGALREAIAEDRAAGRTPWMVVGTAGTVDTGAVDDLAGIAAVCLEEGLWFHVDGALGALGMLSAEIAPRLKGIEQADSLAFDFHKWAQVPYDAGFLLVRDGRLHEAAFSSCSNYLARGDRGMAAGSPWPCDLGVDLSRGFRALKVWMTLKVYGAEAIGAVISGTCALARELGERVVAEAELELMAPVELNTVCFRYLPVGGGWTDGAVDELNEGIVLALQEAGRVAPSTTRIGGRLAIRAAVVNHRTERVDMEMLVEGVLEAGRAAMEAAAVVEAGAETPVESDGRLLGIDGKLAVVGVDVQAEICLRMERAVRLVELGRQMDAREEYLRNLHLDDTHLGNLLALGKLLTATGHTKAAQTVFGEALRHHPDEVVCHVNLGSSLLVGSSDPAAARVHYEAALRMDPNLPQAHGGMYYALQQLGELAQARIHQRKAFGRLNVFHTEYTGEEQAVKVLLLVSSSGGNTPVEKLLDESVFETFVVVADFFDQRLALPAHTLVINGIGDPDVSMEALKAAELLVRKSGAPVVNRPEAVIASGRERNAGRLGRIQGLVTPKMASFAYEVLAGEDGAEVLEGAGFTFPLLLRVPGFHMGRHFERVESATELQGVVAGLPGAGQPGAELLAIEYLDARGAYGCARKYRVMMVGGVLYPLHLAISDNWKIHYFSADMAERADHRAEEALFLKDMTAALGGTAVRALEELQEVLGLDYGGVDFGLNADGEVLLFEANATMVVEQPAEEERWDYRRESVDKIHAAVRRLFLRGVTEEDWVGMGVPVASVAEVGEMA